MHVMENQKESITILAFYIWELICSSSSDNDIEELIILKNKDKRINKKSKVSRIRNYVETIVPELTSQDFKVHFRYYLRRWYLFL